MKKWSGTIEIKSNHKRFFEFITVEATTLQEAYEIAKNLFLARMLKPVEILNINLSEIPNSSKLREKYDKFTKINRNC